MRNDLNLKLIAIIDLTKIILYEAHGLKIPDDPKEIPLSLNQNATQEKRQSLYQKKPSPGSSFEPKTSLKVIIHQEAATKIGQYLEDITTKQSHYKELIVAAEPQMLGYLRQHFSNHLKRIITKEIAKNLVKNNKTSVEEIVFGSKK